MTKYQDQRSHEAEMLDATYAAWSKLSLAEQEALRREVYREDVLGESPDKTKG